MEGVKRRFRIWLLFFFTVRKREMVNRFWFGRRLNTFW